MNSVKWDILFASHTHSVSPTYCREYSEFRLTCSAYMKCLVRWWYIICLWSSCVFQVCPWQKSIRICTGIEEAISGSMMKDIFSTRLSVFALLCKLKNYVVFGHLEEWLKALYHAVRHSSSMNGSWLLDLAVSMCIRSCIGHKSDWYLIIGKLISISCLMGEWGSNVYL